MMPTPTRPGTAAAFTLPLAALPLTLAALAGCTGAPGDDSAPATPYDGAVVALQDQASLGFLDGTGALTHTLDLATEVDGQELPWMVHNVQITPDGLTAVATAMAPMGDTGMAFSVPDELLVIDLASQTLTRRCDLDTGMGIAHVVTDGSTAWATAYTEDILVLVDVATCHELARWPLPAGTGPHGIRRSADGGAFFVAGMGDGSLHRFDLEGTRTSWDLPGLAVQVAVVPDGSAVFATLIDTLQVARLDLATDTVAIVDLPEGAMGPAQIYPSPDSKSVWVADQGATGGIAGHELFQLDAATGALLARVVVSEAPHGVVVSPDGQTVWTTTLGSGTVDRVDVGSLSVVGSTPVGPGPNGISLAVGGSVMP